MAPKGAYTAESLRAIAAKAAAKARIEFADCDLECEYQGGDRVIARRDEVTFQWRVRLAGYEEKFDVTSRCDNADRQGVRFPEKWRTAIPASRLHDLAQKTATGTESSVVSLGCLMLGLPKIAPVPVAGTTCVPGAVVQLQARNLARQDYLLAAHIDGDRRCAHCTIGFV